MPSSALSLQARDPKVEKLAGPEVRKFAIRIIDKKWQAAGPRSQRLLSYWNPWRSLGDSNPCFRRERATSWAARRREQARRFGNSADQRRAQGEPGPSGTARRS